MSVITEHTLSKTVRDAIARTSYQAYIAEGFSSEEANTLAKDAIEIAEDSDIPQCVIDSLEYHAKALRSLRRHVKTVQEVLGITDILNALRKEQYEHRTD